ncbi:hypothetical protein ES703_05371 [subsurface metagenome]
MLNFKYFLFWSKIKILIRFFSVSMGVILITFVFLTSIGYLDLLEEELFLGSL